MQGIELFVDSDGNCGVVNHYQRRDLPVSLKPEELTALQIVIDAIPVVILEKGIFHVERRSNDYLTVVVSEVYDFCRIKSGSRSKWFSLVFSPEDRKSLFFEPRLECVKKKNVLHWQIPIATMQEIQNYSDLIERSYRWALYQAENFPLC